MQNLLLFTCMLAVVFTFRFGAVWLLPLAFLLDAYFGAFATAPVFSLVAVCWYVVFELLRPYMRMV